MFQHDDIPRGYCQCGCGRQTNVAKNSLARTGDIAGVPRRFIRGHHLRASLGPSYLEEDCGFTSKCWVWQWQRDVGGYGRVKLHGQKRGAHRVFYEHFVGPVPEGLQLDHLCRNRACVNPDHLEPVTPAENVRRGAATKLTRREADAIRVASGTFEQIATEFGISDSQVNDIKTGRRWSAP